MKHVRDRNCVYTFGQTTYNKDSLGRPRHRKNNNIKMDLKKIGLASGCGLDL